MVRGVVSIINENDDTCIFVAIENDAADLFQIVTPPVLEAVPFTGLTVCEPRLFHVGHCHGGARRRAYLLSQWIISVSCFFLVNNLADGSDAIELESALERRVTKECLSMYNVNGSMRKVSKSTLLHVFNHDPTP